MIQIKKGETSVPQSRTMKAEAIYEIRVLGTLDPSWSDWFNNAAITYQNGETLLLGEVADQAALLGLLTKIGHLNLTLLSVRRLESQIVQQD
jgi:hypothetical protein